jgi:hypothetical protein
MAFLGMLLRFEIDAINGGDRHEIEDRGNGICDGQTFPKTPQAGF